MPDRVASLSNNFFIALQGVALSVHAGDRSESGRQALPPSNPQFLRNGLRWTPQFLREIRDLLASRRMKAQLLKFYFYALVEFLQKRGQNCPSQLGQYLLDGQCRPGFCWLHIVLHQEIPRPWGSGLSSRSPMGETYSVPSKVRQSVCGRCPACARANFMPNFGLGEGKRRARLLGSGPSLKRIMAAIGPEKQKPAGPVYPGQPMVICRLSGADQLLDSLSSVSNQR